MRNLFYSICSLTVLMCLSTATGFAQNSTGDNVHLFQSFFRDAPISAAPYGEAFVNYTNSDFLNTTTFGAQIGYGITPEIEVGTRIPYMNLDFDEAGTQAGIADIPIFGRYNFMAGETKLSGGAFATVPVGSEDIGQGNVNFGVFGAVRHPASDNVILTGTLGVDFLETAIEDYEASLNFGAGVIYASSEKLHILGELAVQADTDYSALSGGVDYVVSDLLRLRGNLLLGLDDGAPDFGVAGGLLFIL